MSQKMQAELEVEVSRLQGQLDETERRLANACEQASRMPKCEPVEFSALEDSRVAKISSDLEAAELKIRRLETEKANLQEKVDVLEMSKDMVCDQFCVFIIITSRVQLQQILLA